MAVSSNDITGDSLRSRPVSKQYANNYDSIFRKPKPTDEEVLSWKWVNNLGESEVSSDKPMEPT